MADPGSFLDPNLMPFFLQSALMDMPRGARGTSGFVRPMMPMDLENSEPGAAAAYRMQQAVRRDLGRQGQGGEALGRQVLLSATGPGRVAGMATAVAPMLPDNPTSLMRMSNPVLGLADFAGRHATDIAY